MGRPLIVDRVDVRQDAVQAVLRVPQRDERRTSFAFEGRIESLTRMLPGLARHRCDCGSAHGILGELADTETAHAFEHITLELMVLSGSPRSLQGRTEWDFRKDGDGVFRLSLEYDDDAVALGSMRSAGEVIAWLFDKGDEPDIEAMVGRLKRVRAEA